MINQVFGFGSDVFTFLAKKHNMPLNISIIDNTYDILPKNSVNTYYFTAYVFK